MSLKCISPTTTKPKYPCGECHKAVGLGASIACDSYNQWYHSDCVYMSDQMYECYAKNESLEWVCTGCVFVDVSNSSISSDSSFTSTENTRRGEKAKRL